MLYGLDLFSGIGGISLALEQWVRPIAYCENDRYAQAVLLSRMADGTLPRAPIWDDVTTLTAKHLPRGIEIIYGGFPCQDISIANTGERRGLDGDRSGLFYEIIRLVDEIRPRYVFLENVPGIVNGGLDRVCARLASRSYDAQWMHLSAAEVGACHVRNRFWLLANANDQRQLQPQGGEREKRRWVGNGSQSHAAFATSAGLSNGRDGEARAHECTEQLERLLRWPTVAAVCRADDGIQNRVHRIKCLGNSVVPQCAKEAFRILMNT